jgi:hypothetical protein
MLIHNANVTGSMHLNGMDMSTLTGSVSSTTFNQYTSSTNEFTGSANTSITNLNNASGSFSTRVTSLESFSASLDATFATDAQLSSLSGSVAGRLTTDESTISSLQTASGSFSTRTTNLETASGSFSTRTTSNESNISSLNSRTGSYATIEGPNTFNGNQTVTGSLFVTQNLTVLGSSSISYVSQSNLNIGTNLITVNAQNPTTRFGGLAVIDSGSAPQVSGSWLFDSIQNRWIMIHEQAAGAAVTSSIALMGPETYNNLGNETTITLNRIIKGSAGASGEHVGDSQISDDGTTVSIPGRLVVTGSITGSLDGSNITNSSISNAKLANSSVTVTAGSGLSGGGSVALGSSITLTNTITNNNQLTNGAGYITGINSGNVTTALGYTPVPTTRTLTINGTAFDLSADRSWTIAAGVTSFNTRTGAITLQASDISGLGAGILSGSSQVTNISNSQLTNSSITITAGTGLSGGGSTSLGSSVTLSNTGLLSGTAGTGISVSTSSGNLTITNTGLLSGTAGTGISVSTSSGNLTITNTGLLSGVAGTGISVTTSSQQLTITNTGLLSGVAGTGISVSTSSQQLTITNTGLLGATAGTGISVSTSSQNATITNTGVTSITAGSGISISGATGGVTITNTITNNNQLTNGAGYITGINSSMVTSALGYTPYNSSNPSGYITGINSSMVTTALGYTPYNSTNPNGYITGLSFDGLSSKTGGTGTYQTSGDFRAPIFYDSANTGYYLDPNSLSNLNRIQLDHNMATGVGNNSFNVSKSLLGSIHIVNGAGPSSGDGRQAGITFMGGSASESQAGIYVGNNNSAGTYMGFATTDSYATGPQLFMTATNGGIVNFPRATPTVAGNAVLHAGNYNSYSPTLTGGNASGTWSINVTGTAGSETLNTVTSRGATTSNAITTGLLISQGPGGNYNENVRLPGSTAVISFNTSGATGAGSYNIVSQTDFQIRNAGGSQVFIMDQSGNLTMAGSMRTPIFYDSNNTGYYLDPASTSSLNALTMAGSITTPTGTSIYIGNQNVSTSARLIINWHTDSDYQYVIGKRAGGWTQPMDISFYTGLRYHAHQTYNAHIFYVSGYDSTEAFSIGKGDSNVRVNNVLFVSGDARAPIFYDQNDTGYYLDLNSTSRLNQVQFLNRIGIGNGSFPYTNTGSPGVWLSYGGGSNQFMGAQDTNIWGVYVADTWEFTVNSAGTAAAVGDFRAPIFYDSNDTGYYVDFNSTSDSALRMRGGALFGPNTTWGASLYVGGNGRVGTSATVAVTNGNLHMDCQDGNFEMYLNWYSGRPVYTGGNLGVGQASASHRLHVNGTGFATSDFRTPIFYDSNDTTYYLDPASNGTRAAFLNGNVWINPKSESYGEGIAFLMPSQATWGGLRWLRGVSNFTGAWALGYFGNESNDNIGFHSAGTNGWRLDHSWNMTSIGSVRSPIFYDSDDTGRYIDPANISQTNSMRASEFRGNANVGGTGEATWHPAGIYSGGTQWLYGTMYRNGADTYHSNGAIYQVNFLEFNNGFRISQGPSNYGIFNSWVRLDGSYGFYSGTNGAHFYPNNGTYGAWRVDGSKNGWGGFEFTNGSNGAVVLMINNSSNTTGFHNNSYGWQFYWEGGVLYVSKNAYGGGTTATVIDSTNIASYTAGNVNNISSAVGGGYTWTGIQYFQTNNGGQAVNNSNTAALQAFSTSNNSAFMSFHRGGFYAVNFGLDNDNVMRIGGWSAGANRWQLDLGSGNMTVAGDVTAYSDARVKTNVQTIENALEKTLALRGVTYNRTDSEDVRTKVGVIAQEIIEVLPEVVNQDNDGMYNVSYGNITALLIEAIKEQQSQIEELKSIINVLTK